MGPSPGGTTTPTVPPPLLYRALPASRRSGIAIWLLGVALWLLSLIAGAAPARAQDAAPTATDAEAGASTAHVIDTVLTPLASEEGADGDGEPMDDDEPSSVGGHPPTDEDLS